LAFSDVKADGLILGKDVETAGSTIPVISPHWRLKRSGEWTLLWKYDPEEIAYSVVPPLVGATLPLLNGRLTFRHLSMVVQYAHDLDTAGEAGVLLTSVIQEANRKNDTVVAMTPGVAPYVKEYDPLDFVSAPLDGAQKRLAYPLSLNLMFSNACQTKCVYCYAHRRRVSLSRHLSRERWMEIFREARALGIEQVSLSGGDPLFRRDALTLISELIRLEMLFLLSTKCHITPEMADRLVDMGMAAPINQYMRELQISLDGPDAKIADAMASSPGYFDRAIDSVKNLVARGFNLRVKAVATPFNTPRIYEWVELMVKMGVRRVSVAAYNRTFYRHRDELFLSSEDRRSIGEQCTRARSDFPGLELRMSGLDPIDVPQAQSFGARLGSPERPGQTEYKAEAWRARAHCSGGRSSITITPDGKVVLCDTVPQEGVFVVGDVSGQSIADVWNSEELVNFTYPAREQFIDSACYGCGERADCHGRAGYCFRDTYFNYGTIYGPPPRCPYAPDDGMRME
jgi:radical SAM protein with 4Fe4S-binding SPASM domain